MRPATVVLVLVRALIFIMIAILHHDDDAARKLPRSSKAKELDVIGDLGDSKPKAKSGGCCGGGGGGAGAGSA